MRVMVKAQVPTVAGSKGVKDGKLPETIKAFMEKTKPECAYFGAEDGRRTMWAVIDLKDVSDMPPFFEPLFMNLEAEVSVVPVMVSDDLVAGFGKLK
jgi:hypothetical protein